MPKAFGGDISLAAKSEGSSSTNEEDGSGNRVNRKVDDLQNVEGDGRNYERQKDPPGQRSVYILPGDAHKESYRLSTFYKFPRNAPINECALATHGFLYTGYKDRVKCFSCGAQVQDWVQGDNPTLTKWHQPDCNLVLDKESLNQSIGTRPIQFRTQANSFSPTSSIDSAYYSMSSSSSSSGSMVPKNLSTTQINGEKSASEVGNLSQSMSLIQLGNNNVINMNSASFSVRESAVQAARVTEKRNTISQLQELQLANIVSHDHKELITENLDLRKEEDRKKSFTNWSAENLTVTPEFLAKSGFFYLGNLDRVQCFSCAGVLRNWRSGDDVDTEHKRHFPHCKMVMKTETRNVPLVRSKVAPILEMIEPPNPLPEDVPHLEAQFPCANPVNPHMRSETMRFDTFDTRWPKDKVKAIPIQIAKAGFYFLGERDRAKCWYCNGGLQNWDYNDEPWTEHAKWFPGCEFILRQKGVAFVKNTFRKFPNLPRPTLRNSRFDAQTGEIIYRSAPLPLRSVTTVIDPRRTMSAGMVLSSSPNRPMVQADETLSFSSRDQHMMRDVENMGFDRKKIERLVKQRIDDTNRGFESTEQLVEAVLSAPEDEAANEDINSDEERADLSMDETGSEGNEESNVPSLKISLKRKDNHDVGNHKKEVQSDTRPSKMLKSGRTQGLNEKLVALKSERKCKSCLHNDADTVVMPCGHLSLCRNCSSTAINCPICKRKAQKFIKAYMA